MVHTDVKISLSTVTLREKRRPGLANLWQAERFPWHAAFTAVHFSIYFARPASPYSEKHVCIYTDISDCIETVYGLPLLPNNTEMKHYYTNRSGAKY